jgi:hypothetical protein
MGYKAGLVVALSGLLAGAALAQDDPVPPALELPTGAQVRLRTASSDWVRGVLVSAHRGTISLVPEEAPPLGDNQLRVPTDAVHRLELLTARKRQWRPGLVIGAALGVLAGATTSVDPVQCRFDDSAFCSRGEAVGVLGATMAGLGALVGSLVKTDVWTPVALDALGPSRPRPPDPGLRLQSVPGGVGVAVSMRF